MKAVMKKAGEVALSILLVSLICVPIPAMSAFADEADGETQEESELTPEELLKLKQLKEAQTEGASETSEASELSTEAPEADANESVNSDETDTADETKADSQADDTTNSDSTTNADKAPEATENADATAPDTEQPATDTATKETKAAAADAATVSTADELTAAFATANAYTGGTYTITLANDIVLPTSVSVASGKNVTLASDGHTITLDGSAALNANGTLTLDGLTVAASGSHTGTMVVVDGGTLNMNSGVLIEGNGSDTAVAGGGVSVSNKGTFNMNGGVIENCVAAKGGGVYVLASAFNMSGDASIRDCSVQSASVLDSGDGAGVFLDTDKRTVTTMTMSGNATIRDNAAIGIGGGVFLNNRTTLTMEGNASIVGNAADAAGGVMNYGMATLTAVYGNTARQGADDIFNNGRMLLSPTNPDWVLPRTGTHVTGWYEDYYHAVDKDGSQGDGGHRWAPEAEDSVEYVPTGKVTNEVLTLTAGAPLVTVIWENEDGTVLYEVHNLQPTEVPAADEFTELSGQDDPTEPETVDGSEHEFTGWTETHPSETEVIYIANYKNVDTHDPDELVDVPTAPTTDDPTAPIPDDPAAPIVDDPTAPTVGDPTNSDTAPKPAGTYSGTASDNTSATGAALQQTGDHAGNAGMTLAALMGLSAIALGAAAVSRKRAK